MERYWFRELGGNTLKISDGVINNYQGELDIFKTKVDGKIENLSLIVLTEGILNEWESIRLLLDNKIPDAVFIIYRTILEQWAAVRFILQDNTAVRGQAYIYYQKAENAYISINFLKTLHDKNEREKFKQIFTEAVKSDGQNFNSPEEYKTYYYNKFKHLVQWSSSRPVKIRKWQQIEESQKSGKLATLFEQVGLSKVYKGLYSTASIDVHGAASVDNIEPADEGFLVNYTVTSQKMDTLCLHVVIDVFAKVIKYFHLKDNLEIKGYIKNTAILVRINKKLN